MVAVVIAVVVLDVVPVVLAVVDADVVLELVADDVCELDGVDDSVLERLVV